MVAAVSRPEITARDEATTVTAMALSSCRGLYHRRLLDCGGSKVWISAFGKDDGENWGSLLQMRVVTVHLVLKRVKDRRKIEGKEEKRLFVLYLC